MTLDSCRGERAMVIKNDQGDWGILKGAWTGYVKGKPPKVSGTTGKRGDPGYLSVSFYDITADRLTEITVLNAYGHKTGARSKKFKLAQSTVCLSKGQVVIDGSCTHVAENLALSMGVAVMFVLCEPRMSPPGVQSKETSSTQQPMYRSHNRVGLIRRPKHRNMRKGSHDPPKLTVKRRGSIAVQQIKADNINVFQAAGYNTETSCNSWLYWKSIQKKDEDEEEDSEPESEDEGCLVDEDITDDDAYCDVIGELTGSALFCPWNPDGDVDGADPSGCGGCGGCAASCGGASASCGISTACGAGHAGLDMGSSDEETERRGMYD